MSFGQDYWSASLGTPQKDAQQDLTIRSVNQTGGYTMVDFKRPASTNDMKDVQFTVRSRDTCSRGFLFFVRNNLANLSVRPRPHVTYGYSNRISSSARIRIRSSIQDSSVTIVNRACVIRQSELATGKTITFRFRAEAILNSYVVKTEDYI